VTKNWKEVAWNGVRFKTPVKWEIVQIGTRHLVLENGMVPVMEVKWGPVKGHFSHKAHLKRLAALHPRNVKGRVAVWFLPPHWQAALTDYETSGFLWQGEAAIGRGAILFCPVCRNAALIQFFRYNSSDQEKILLAVLKSFRDHRQDGLMQWSVFDIRVTLPETLELTQFRFDVGKFEIGFAHGRQFTYLHRWAPAAALLDGGDLRGFIRTVSEFSAGLPQPLMHASDDALTWCLSPTSVWQRRLLSRLKLNPSFFWYRIWHVKEKNRILGIRSESKYPLDSQLLDQISTVYESI
jgi:hypothetical protein